MDENKALDPKWIVNEVEKHCDYIQKELVNSGISGEYYQTAELIRRNVDITFSLGIAESCPLGYVNGERESDWYWESKALQCTAVNRNEQGYLELDNPQYPWVSYVFCNFSYFDSSFGPSKFDQIRMSIRRSKACYPPLPEKCEKMPESIESSFGGGDVVKFAIDRTNGKLAYVFYEHWGYSNRATSQWDWAHPDYDAKALVERAIKEHGKISLESAHAHDLLYEQKCLGDDRVIAQMACNQATSIYYQLYGADSNHPAVIAAVQRDFEAITKSSYIYYKKMLTSYKHMLRIKEAHPEVTEFPDVEELRALVAKYEPLEKEETWNRYLRD